MIKFEKDKLLETLMIKAQAGDMLAYRELLDQLSVLIPKLARNRVPADMLDDLIQEVLFSVHKARHTYDPCRSFFAWFCAINDFRVNDILRQKYRHSKKIIKITEERNVEDPDNHERLYEIIEQLPEKQREVITRLKLQGYSISEVAEKMSLSVAAVKMIAHRSYEKIRMLLKENI